MIVNARTVTVIGKLDDTRQYVGQYLANVLTDRPDWSPELQRAWLDEAIARGDLFLIASSEYTGQFREELIYLLQRITEKEPCDQPATTRADPIDMVSA